mmetsp:Transcript_37424/g.120042  ORF Transcript_37424/g.120042 Transcript_37424/m.120042 type:complete len:309 (+) Transcript_37424:59-985(+)
MKVVSCFLASPLLFLSPSKRQFSVVPPPLKAAAEEPAAGPFAEERVKAAESRAEAQSRFDTVMGGAWFGSWQSYDVNGDKVADHEGGLEIEGPVQKLFIDGKQVRSGIVKPSAFVVAPPAAAVGPSGNRRGLWSMEVTLRHESARARVTIQYAPAQAGRNRALKLFKATVAREGSFESWPATPYDWRKAWRGDTTVATSLNEKTLPDMTFDSDKDYWHNSRAGDADYTLSQGNILVQAPTLITWNIVTPETLFLRQNHHPVPIRLAWLPTPDVLLRAESLVLFPPLHSEPPFHPPRMLTLQVDNLHAP